VDKDNFKFHMLLLAESTNKRLGADDGTPSPLLRFWWEKYGALPDEVLLAAFGQAIDTCRFFPSVAEFNAIVTLVRRATGDPDATRPEDEAAALLRKVARYNPDLGIVNDGTRGLLLARGGDRGEDWDGSGFTARERAVLRLFGGAVRAAAWDDKDVQFNRPRVIEAFAALATDDHLAARVAAGGRSVADLQAEAAKRRLG
jgi:hypothetical protein